jgi:hypothetical protein
MFALVFLGGALLVWGGLYMVNRRVERQVEKLLDRSIRQAGLEGQLSYDTVNTQVAFGLFTVRGIEYEGAQSAARAGLPAGSLQIRSASLDLPTREAPRLLQSGGSVSFTEAELSFEGLQAGSTSGGDELLAKKLLIEARGEIGPQLLSLPLREIPRYLFSLRLDIREGSLRPGERTRAWLTEYVGFDPLRDIRQTDITRVSAAASLARSAREVHVSETEIDAELLQLQAEGKIELDAEMLPRGGEGRVTVARIDPQLREPLQWLFPECEAALSARKSCVLQLEYEKKGRLQYSVQQQ